MVGSKIKNIAQLRKIAAGLKKRDKKIVFTNGCFDILHFGHVKYLEQAKKKGDILIVGLNSDSSVKKIKGRARPFTGQKQRACVLSALSFVDYVIIFNEKTPYSLIKTLRPDVLVKGGDWPKDKIVGSGIVCKYGGKTVTIPYVRGCSTTKLIQKIIG